MTTQDCPTSLLCCGAGVTNLCLDVQSDTLHCGSCDVSCGSSADSCVGGTCSCGPAGLSCTLDQLCCAGVCTTVDDSNCGACGVPCSEIDGGVDLGPDLASPPGPFVAAALVVDPPSAGSSANGILEPHETVTFAPSWRNAGTSDVAAVGTLSAMAMSGVSIDDDAADYGIVAVGATAQCTDCYTITAMGHRPSQHWDLQVAELLGDMLGAKSWTVHVGASFMDVTPDNLYYAYVETLLHDNIAGGCGHNDFCPTTVIVRSELAVFVALAALFPAGTLPVSGTVGNATYNCVAGGGSAFIDISPTDAFCKHVHWMAAKGFEPGCAKSHYCPGDNVLRADLATIVAAALVGAGNSVPLSYTDPVTTLSYDCNAAGSKLHFNDVHPSDAACAAIHYLWAKGIAAGCTVDTFCPTDGAARGEAAAYIAKAWQLPLYGP
jgi:hypothetical protein